MIPQWRGARPEPLQIAIVGDVAPWRWPRGWFYMLVSAPVIKPKRPLHETLYPRGDYRYTSINRPPAPFRARRDKCGALTGGRLPPDGHSGVR